MTETLTAIGLSASVMAAVTTLLLQLWPAVLPPSPDAGERGIRRREALRKNAWFRKAEPILRVLSLKISRLPAGPLQMRAEKIAQKAGFIFGIDGCDLLALCVVGAMLGGLLFGGAASQLNRPVQGAVMVGIIFGAFFPRLKLQDIAKHRFLCICRGLPGAVDLISLSMESGLDFTSAVRQTANRLQTADPLRFELEHILHKMSLGSARSDALLSFSQRVPAATIRQFTAAVIQAEKRGTPLSEVLAVQAKVQRTKRSQAAEQAAAKAAVLLIGPLMLIFACVFIIILGPFVVEYANGNFF